MDALDGHLVRACPFEPQSIQSARLAVQAVVRIGYPDTLSCRGVLLPPLGPRGEHACVGEGEGGTKF